MKPRSLLLALPAALVLFPLTAEARERPLGELSERLGDPETQDRMADAMAAMTAALMKIDLAPMADAMDRMGDRKTARKLARHGTIGELAGRDAERVPQTIRRQMPQMMGAMAGMTGAMEAMLPQLEAMARSMGGAMEGAIGGMRDRLPKDDSDYGPPAGEAVEE